MGLFGNKHEKDFAELRRSVRKRSLKWLWIIPIIFLLVLLISIYGSTKTETNLKKAKLETLRLNASWAQDLVAQQESASRWLSRHQIIADVKLFNSLSTHVFQLAQVLGSGEEGALSSFYGYTLTGILRIFFIFFGCIRVWIVIVMIAAIHAYNKIKPYVADDLLGQTGNGRIFYSGMRASLDNMDESGAPDVLVRGLACLKRCSPQVLAQSEILKVLNKYGVDNETNKALAAMIVEYGDYPAYVAKTGEEGDLASAYKGSTLVDNTTALLDCALSLHSEYSKNGAPSFKTYLPEQKTPSAKNQISSSQAMLSGEDYIAKFRQALDRVLTPQQKQSLISIRAEGVATALLAIEAAKPLGVESAGVAWIRSTNFPQLGARAVLHSVPEYPREYRSAERNMIRQALVYGLRKSVFGPVRFSVDITKESQALRQWVEVTLACPHELDFVADDVQLFGITYELHESWEAAFFKELSENNKSIFGEGIATDSSMFFLPVLSVLGIFSKVIDIDKKVILKELVRRVDEWQHKGKTEQEESDGVAIPDYERIPRDFTQSEIAEIVDVHDLPASKVAEWGYLRYILYHYSWLARRVGDSTVPEACVVFAAVQVDEGAPDRNESGYIGRAGMVPLRTTRLVERYGQSWKEKFRQGRAPAIATTHEQFNLIMQGIPIFIDDASDSLSS